MGGIERAAAFVCGRPPDRPNCRLPARGAPTPLLVSPLEGGRDCIFLGELVGVGWGMVGGVRACAGVRLRAAARSPIPPPACAQTSALLTPHSTLFLFNSIPPPF